jgi:CheY-like chemotaxis protein
MRVLVVEDNPMNMELITDLLEARGIDFLKSENAEEGIRLARQEHPDIILMDIQLPGMDGLEATRILKADPDTVSIPIVALTAHAVSGYEEVVKEAGCDGYITKPLNTRNVVNQILGFIPK